MSQFLLAALAACLCLASCGKHRPADSVIVIDAIGAPANTFFPDTAFGAALDGVPAGDVARLYTPHNIAVMKTAGLRPISYSLRSELAGDAWHWGEEGSWSDRAHARGYWTTSDNPRRPVLTGWGYALPRRGNSVDQADDDGYSRLDDGDPGTFWKSNPYLDPFYTHAPARPQWVTVAFDRPTPIAAARIVWARPFARRFRVQYWTGVDEYDDEGNWRDFPQGVEHAGDGGAAVLRLAEMPISARYIRILLEESSHNAPRGARDPRDAMGYAIAEIGLGRLGRNGRFIDAVQHQRTGAHQTGMTVSSTDPWHRARDRDTGAEQPGFDRLYRSGITGGVPMVVPVGVLYDTPENAAAEMRFLRRRHYPVSGIEIGEEPDGQNISPEDFAALYRQFGAAVHGVDPSARIGGPNLQDAVSDTWLDAGKEHSWTRRFLAAIDTPGHRAPLNFFSFEHYPFDNLCGRLDRKLVDATGILATDMARLHDDGVPSGIPWIITEYGFSAFSGEGEVQLPGALFDADMIAHFLALGGRSSFLLGYGPDQLYDPDTTCAGYGELMLFGEDAHGQATWPTPAYWAIWLLTHEWAQPGDRSHRLYPAAIQVSAGQPQGLITAYPLRRPDGDWAVLLINRDPSHGHSVTLEIADKDGRREPKGPYDVAQYNARDFVWHADGPAGHPIRDDSPHHSRLPGGAVGLPAYSITIVRTLPANGARVAIRTAVPGAWPIRPKFRRP